MPEPRPNLKHVGALAIAVVALAGCGGGDGDNGADGGTTAASPGATVYADAGCGNCHTFEPAGSSGTVGPNLDDADVSVADAERQVREGGSGMPSFDDELSDQEIRDVAEFVAGG